MLIEMWNVFLERRDFFVDLTIEHLSISLIVIFFATIVGGIIGVLLAEYRRGVKVSLSLINFLYTIPAISMLGFLIPFSGIGNTTAIIALTIYALLPVVRSTYTGLTNIDPIIIEAATGMGSTRKQTLLKVKIPLAMPVIMSGIRNMVIMTIALAGIASFIGAGGLGVAIYRGITINNGAMTMVGSLLIAILALTMDLFLGLIEKKFVVTQKTSKRKLGVLVATIAIIFTVIIVNIFVPTNKNTIKIATKPMTEQYILGEMLKLLIEQDTDLEVEITHGVGGGSANIHPAMENGEFDLYSEYTGTGWNAILKHESIYTEDMFDDMNLEYNQRFNMQWVGKYGFNNTYGLAVRKETALKYDLKTYSDLQDISKDLVFGAEYDFFEREDGYNELVKTYNLDFMQTVDLDIGLKYDAITQKNIDVMVIFTTDGKLATSDIVVLEDDKNFYPSYMCVNVIRNQTLKKYPELEEVLNKLTNVISDSEMAQMNNDVETNGKRPKDVAREFLTQKEMLEE